MKNKTILAAIITTLLVGCGSGGSGDNGGNTGTPAASFGGKAIDGYITGGTAFIDYNYNGKLDAGEPSAITGDKGTFELTPTGELATCADYAPVIIDVPVGAIDSDFGPVTEAYKMVHPPVFATPGHTDTRITTPLTTVVWSSISGELIADGVTDCSDVAKNEVMRADIERRVDQQEWQVAHRYGVTIEDLYSDFIESGDTALHQLAVDIVPMLQKSFEETKTLEDTYPNANYVSVEYFIGRWDEEAMAMDTKTYREETVYTLLGWEKLTEEYSENLETNLGIVYDAENIEHVDNKVGVKYELLREFETGTNNNRCSVNEYIVQAPVIEKQTRTDGEGNEYTVDVVVANGGTVYGVRNLSSNTVVDTAECSTFDYATNVTNRMLLTDDGATESSEHMYFGTNLVGYDHLIGLDTTYQNVDTSDLDIISVIPTDFNDDGFYNADRWTRTRNTKDDAGTQTLLIKDSDGNLSKLTTAANGIQTIECSQDSGNTWTTVGNLSECSI